MRLVYEDSLQVTAGLQLVHVRHEQLVLGDGHIGANNDQPGHVRERLASDDLAALEVNNVDTLLLHPPDHIIEKPGEWHDDNGCPSSPHHRGDHEQIALPCSRWQHTN